MSSKRKPRQILGMNNSKLESDMGMGRTFGYNGNNNQNEKPDATNINWEYHNFSNEYNSTSVTNDSVLCSKNENENKFFLNQSKEAFAMNLENVNRIRLEEMASYWPYAQFISPFCAPPTYGIISSGPGVTYHQVPYFPANPAMPATTYENRNQFSSDSNECSSSNGTNSNSSSAPSIKLSQNISLKLEDNNGNVNASGIILNQKQFVELTRLAMRGSETAERIAYTHRNRPCFKKIDSLCARMKQDLIRPDGVLPNINSQGIAWAVKDFIFVFTRVINAWIIIKGYVYNTPEGLNKIKAALSSDFLRSFAAWQDTTMDFVENLIKSFVNLDQLVQSQKTPFQKSENISKSSTSSTPIKSSNQNLNFESNENFDESFDFLNLPTENILTPQATGTTSVTSKSTVDNVGQTLNKSYYSTLIEDSEESQRKATVNGTYFKTGVYNPIWKDSISEMDPLYFPGKKDSIDPILENLPLASTLEKVLPITFGTTNAVEDLVWSSQQNTTISLFSPTENSNVLNNGSNNVSASNGNNSANNNGSNSINNNNNNSNNTNNNNNNNNNACTSHQNTNNLSNNNSDISNISYCAPINGEGDGKLFDLTRNISTGQIPKNCFSYDLKVLEKNVSKFSNSFDPTVTKPIGQDTVKKLEILLKKIQNLPEGNLFFEERFMKNYFPDFMSKSPKFLDLRSIFLKAQVGGYAHINEFVQDLKLISQYVNIYLKGTKHEMLESAINKYDSAINKILKEEIFKECNFDFKTEVTQSNNINYSNNNNI